MKPSGLLGWISHRARKTLQLLFIYNEEAIGLKIILKSGL
jgi:hypothetical protein